MAQSGENLGEISSVVVGLIFFALVLFLIDHFSYVFVNSWYYFRVVQLTMLNYLPDWLPLTELIPYDKGYDILRNADPSNMDGEFISQFDSFFAPYMSWIPALFVYHLYKKLGDKAQGVTQKFSMEEILKKNAATFPFLKPYINFNPATMVDLDFERDDKHKLQYLPSLSPVKFATMVPPLGLEKEAEKKEAFRLPLWDGEDTFDEDLAKRAFEKQLQNHFSSVEDSFTEAQQKIFDYLSPKAGMDRNFTIKLIKEYCKEISKGNGVYAGDESKLTFHRKNLVIRLESLYKLLADTKDEKFASSTFTNPKKIRELAFREKFEPLYARIHAENIMSNHGFVVTGLMSLLEEGRGGGVIPCVEFIWLKGEDRPLWYALQSVGRKTAFSEAAGAYSHWLLEKMVGKAITQPEVSSAIEALKLALFVDKKSLQKKKRQKEKMGF